MKRYENLIRKAYNSTAETHHSHHVREHQSSEMPRFTFCGDGYFPESPLRIVVRQIKSIGPDYNPHIELHTHDIDELYIVISEEYGGLSVDVTLGDETYEVISPTTIFLPKNLPHKYAAKKGHGFVFTVVAVPCSENYNQHTFDYKK